MSANWNLPTLSSTYTNFVTEVDDRLDDLVLGMRSDMVTATNVPAGAIRWNSANANWESYNGSTWSVLITTAFNITSAAAVSWATARNLVISGDGSGTFSSINGTANVTASLTLATVNSNVGTFGSTTAVPVITANAKGLITALTTTPLATMALQASTNVSITGGAMGGVAITLPSGSGSTTEGVIQWNTGSDLLTVGTGGATKTFVDTNSTQTLLNKTWNGEAVGINYGGTGATSANDALNNLLPSGELSGYVLKTTGPGGYYWAAEGTGGTSSGSTVQSQRQLVSATASQTLFTCGTYTAGANQLRVYQNGVRQSLSDYTETSSTSFTLAVAANAGDLILWEIDGYIQYDFTAAVISFSPTGGIAATTVQNALSELDTEKVYRAGDTMTGSLSFSGTGLRITGDFSNATVTNRIMFQNSVTDNNSFIGVLPSGTATSSGLTAFMASDPTNSSYAAIRAGSSTIDILSDKLGTGSYLPLTVLVGGSERARMSINGGFSVGTTADPGSGAIYATGNITAYYTSDSRFKTNIADINNALNIVKDIGGKTFHWTQEYIDTHGGEDGYFINKEDYGVIAQDVMRAFPLAARTKPDGSLAVDYQKLAAVAFAAIKELDAKIEVLEAKCRTQS